MQSLSDLSGFAVELGTSKIVAASIEDGSVTDLHVRRLTWKPERGPLVVQLTDALQEVGFLTSRPIGVSAIGQLDSDGNWTTAGPHRTDPHRKLNLTRSLTKAFGSDAYALNNAQAAAIGECRFGVGKKARSLAYLSVSDRIFAGFVFDGSLLQSPNGMLGHVGLLTSKLGIRMCESGRFGTFDSVASGRAIEARAAELTPLKLDLECVLESAASGIIWAQILVDEASAAIAELCADLSSSLGIELIVLGGQLGFEEDFLQLVKLHLQDEPKTYRPEVVLSGLGKNSSLFGALSTVVFGLDSY